MSFKHTNVQIIANFATAIINEFCANISSMTQLLILNHTTNNYHAIHQDLTPLELTFSLVPLAQDQTVA